MRGIKLDHDRLLALARIPGMSSYDVALAMCCNPNTVKRICSDHEISLGIGRGGDRISPAYRPRKARWMAERRA